jgi:hypothetical protein
MRPLPDKPLAGVIPYAADPDAPTIAATGILPGSAGTPLRWSDYVLPADDQGQQPSCVGRAWAGWIEAMVRRYVGKDAFPQGCQVDARSIWQRGREMFWGGSLDGGLMLDQGGQACIDLGLLPAGTRLVRVDRDWAAVGEALLATPLIQAHGIGRGWYAVSSQSGCLDHVFAPDPGRYGYHCTLCVERMMQGNQKWICLQNSWGTSWGFYGYGLMRLDLWTDSLIPSGLWTAILPPAFSVQSWSAWRGFLVHA